MRRYKERVSDVSHIISKMVKQGLVNKEDDIINDHIAFRTMGVQHLGIQSLEKIFLALGYKKRDYYYFPKKKVDAHWFSPPEYISNLPRVFISECRVYEMSSECRDIIYKYTNAIESDPVDRLDLMDGEAVDTFLHQSLWDIPTWEEYSRVLEESEYAAWVLYNKYYLNHFTITIQALNKGFDTIKRFSEFLESIGITLNSAGGKIKQSGDGCLLQSASVAKEIEATFPTSDGRLETHKIAGSYVEFAQRIGGRDGFDAGNADKIFESTFLEQISKEKQVY